MFPWYVWLGLGLVLFVFATVFTYVWWKVGDQWADAEYKKFGHGGGGPVDTSKATVIKGFGDRDGDAPVVMKDTGSDAGSGQVGE